MREDLIYENLCFLHIEQWGGLLLHEKGKGHFHWDVSHPGNSYPIEENPRDKVEFRIEAVSLNAKSMEKLTPLEFEKFATFSHTNSGHLISISTVHNCLIR